MVHKHLSAHQCDSTGFTRSSEVFIGNGVVTVDQAAAIGEGGPFIWLKAMPHKVTGAAFLTYRYYIDDRVAIGLTAGLDNQNGNLSFGDPHSPGNGNPGWAGAYKRHIYTVAVELLFIYRRQGTYLVYGYAGSGYTTGTVDYSFNAEGEQYFQSYNKPYIRAISHYNAQITPFGIKGGRRFAGFFELGFGYKGLLSAGCSLRIG